MRYTLTKDNYRKGIFMKGSQVAAIAVRMATAVVFIVNVQCALSFVLQPVLTDSSLSTLLAS